MSTQSFGQLAKDFAGKTLPLEVLQSAAGYYIGTYCHDPEFEGPCTRESVEFRTEAKAKIALELGEWTQREHL